MGTVSSAISTFNLYLCNGSMGSTCGMHFGAHVDVLGLRMDDISPQLIDDTLALYPRLGFKVAFTQAQAEVASRKPHNAIETGLATLDVALCRASILPTFVTCSLVRLSKADSFRVKHHLTKAAEAALSSPLQATYRRYRW